MTATAHDNVSAAIVPARDLYDPPRSASDALNPPRLSHVPAVDPNAVARTSGTIVAIAARNPAAYDGFRAVTAIVDRRL